jgi:hypothetical protein
MLNIVSFSNGELTLRIHCLRPQKKEPEVMKKEVCYRFENKQLATYFLENEWRWHIRGEAQSYTDLCQHIWDELTHGGARVQAKADIEKSFDIIYRFITYANERNLDITALVDYFNKMQQHFLYILPPTYHGHYPALKLVVEELVSLKDQMQKHIENHTSLIPEA